MLALSLSVFSWRTIIPQVIVGHARIGGPILRGLRAIMVSPLPRRSPVVGAFSCLTLEQLVQPGRPIDRREGPGVHWEAYHRRLWRSSQQIASLSPDECATVAHLGLKAAPRARPPRRPLRRRYSATRRGWAGGFTPRSLTGFVALGLSRFSAHSKVSLSPGFCLGVLAPIR